MISLCAEVEVLTAGLVRLVGPACSIGGIVVDRTIWAILDPVLVFCPLSRSVGQSVKAAAC